METDAFVDCISFMAEKGIYIDAFSGDRHRGVGAAIKRELSQLIGDHQYDIFHISERSRKIWPGGPRPRNARLSHTGRQV